MKISKDLNLVIERPQEDGSVLRVHSMPIPLSVYEDNALVIGEAMVRSYSSGLTPQSIVRVVAPTMRDIARDRARALGLPDNAPTEYDRLLAEVRRRTMVLVPRNSGLDPMAFEEALQADVFDEEDVSELDGLTLFFSAAWRFHGKTGRMAIVEPAARIWNGSVTSSTSTEYAASLGTSMPAASSGGSMHRQQFNGGAQPTSQATLGADRPGASSLSSLPS